MTISATLKCPLCNNSFIKRDKSLVCENKHTYDIARSGYVNLLPVNEKSSKNPGDSKEMIAARTNFLNTDHYLPIIDHSQDIAINIFSPYDFKELLRVAKENAIIILVIPNDKHLIEIKNLVYKNQQNYTSNERLLGKLQEHPNLKIVNTEQLTYNFNLNNQETIKNLFAMTPFYWKSSQDIQKILADKESMQVTVDVKIVFLQKKRILIK